MFAVGVCANCSAPICGVHGVHSNGRFVCRTHIAAEEAAAARHARTLESERVKIAREAVAREEEEVRELLPGFPEESATGEELVAALEHLLPEQKRVFKLYGENVGRRARASGWVFELGKASKYPAVVVIGENDSWRRQPKALERWRLWYLRSDRSRPQGGWQAVDALFLGVLGDTPTEKIDGNSLLHVRNQVLRILDRRPVNFATLEQRYLLEPYPKAPYEDWARHNLVCVWAEVPSSGPARQVVPTSGLPDPFCDTLTRQRPQPDPPCRP
jgi:hypothetical protein